MEGNVNQLYENQRKMAGLTGKPTQNEVAMNTQTTKTSDVNDIAKQVAAILKGNTTKKSDCSKTKDGKVQLPLQQYSSYCHSGGINLHCNRQGDTCHRLCPSNWSTKIKPAPGWNAMHDKLQPSLTRRKDQNNSLTNGRDGSVWMAHMLTQRRNYLIAEPIFNGV